jgi:hypothetical protein
VGWCSATEIIDTALGAVEAGIAAAYEALGVDEERVTLADVRGELDDALRPFVQILAEKLRDNDWDCVDESEYFERFPQEMLGHSDSEHRAWLAEMVKDTDGEQKWVDALSAFNTKTKEQASGR